MIFLYHGVVSDDSPPERSCAGQALPLSAFQRQIDWLKDHFELVSLADYLDAMGKERRSRLASITFDDGLARTVDLVSHVLQSSNTPATLFVITSNLERHGVLWFSYLNALCFERIYDSILVQGKIYKLGTIGDRRRARSTLGTMASQSSSPSRFVNDLRDRYPLPEWAFAEYQGMAADQLSILSSYGCYEIGSHTITHPYLTQLSEDEQAEEIIESKAMLSKLTNREIRYFAYPAGDYNRDTLRLVKETGYEAAFATIPKDLGDDARMEMGRIGIYSPSLLKLKVKSFGVVEHLRTLGLRVG